MDKKGVLSWSNPTAEKVFFLRNDLPVTDTGAEQVRDSKHSSDSNSSVADRSDNKCDEDYITQDTKVHGEMTIYCCSEMYLLCSGNI